MNGNTKTLRLANILGERLVTSHTQIPSNHQSTSQDVLNYIYTLKEPYVYYRRGDSAKCYQPNSNFIPLWCYLLMFNQVILYLRATRDQDGNPSNNKEAFRDYCGMYPEELLPFIEENRIIVLLENDINAYHEDVFSEFFNKLPKDTMLMRAQLWEDIVCLKSGMDFSQRKQERTKRIINLFSSTASNSALKKYMSLSRHNNLVPIGSGEKNTIIKLAEFVAEKCEWHKILNLESNIDLIEKAIKDSVNSSDTYVDVYQMAHCLHYVVVHDVYSRKGFLALAHKEDAIIAKYIKELPVIMPLQTKHYDDIQDTASGIGVSIKFPFPRNTDPSESKRSVSILQNILADRDLRDAIQNNINCVSEFRKVLEFHSNPIDYRVKRVHDVIDAKNVYNELIEKYVRDHGEELLNNGIQDTVIGMIGCSDSKTAVNESLIKHLWRNLPDYFRIFALAHLHIDPITCLAEEAFREMQKKSDEEYIELISRSLGSMNISLPSDFREAPCVIINYPN